MLTIRKVALCAAALLAGPGLRIAAADTASPNSAAESFTLRVEQKARHMHEVLDLMHSNDQATRAMATQMALTDTDPVVRGMAISAYLTRFNALTPQVVVETGGPVGQEDAPSLSMRQVTWSQDGRSFEAVLSVTCGPYGIRGQIAGGKLSVHFDGVCLSPALSRNDADSTVQATAAKPTADPCTLVLSPDTQGDALDGPLRCVGVAIAPRVTLAFGA